jgi:uncharacterized membrane protein YhaH (DUF805 family)
MYQFLMDFGRFSLVGLKRAFDFKGTATKPEFWFFFLFFFVAYAVVWVLDHFFLTATVNIKALPLGELLPGGYVDPEVGIAVLLFRPVMAIPTLSATVRRLHDIGKSGWWSCLWVLPVPVLGWFWLIPWLLQPSQPNKSAE